MARFERSKGKKRDYSDSSSEKTFKSWNEDNPRGKKSFGKSDSRERRFSSRDSKRNSRNRRDFEMTKVTCSSCGDQCEVPFKPTSGKPVYCSNCFSKQEQSSSDRPSNKNFEILNEKLNKIMKALDIE